MTAKDQIVSYLKEGINPYKIARKVYGPRPTKAQEQYVYQVCKENKE